MPFQASAQRRPRRRVAALEKLLRHVVAEDVRREVDGVGQHLRQRGGDLVARRALQPLLDEPAAMLVARELADVPRDVRQGQTRDFPQLGVVLERLQKRRPRRRVAAAAKESIAAAARTRPVVRRRVEVRVPAAAVRGVSVVAVVPPRVFAAVSPAGFAAAACAAQRRRFPPGRTLAFVPAGGVRVRELARA